MLPNPLHPAIVHFPIVLMILLPISAAVALWAIGRGTRPLIAWAVPTAFAAALALSSWAALSTGGEQAEAVEAKATEQYVEQHEESAELFLGLSVGVLAFRLRRAPSGLCPRSGANASRPNRCRGDTGEHAGRRIERGSPVRGTLQQTERLD